jgi:hypothetical protein
MDINLLGVAILAETYCGKVHEIGDKRTCPECTTVNRLIPNGNPLGPPYADVKNPVYLVLRTNSKTGDLMGEIATLINTELGRRV